MPYSAFASEGVEYGRSSYALVHSKKEGFVRSLFEIGRHVLMNQRYQKRQHRASDSMLVHMGLADNFGLVGILNPPWRANR